MEGVASGDVAPRSSRAPVGGVAAAVASVHLLKGLARLPAEPGAGLAVVVACLLLVAVQLRHVEPGLRRAVPAAPPVAWTLTELAVGWLAVVPLGVSIGLLCLPAASLLLERRRTPLFLLGGAAALTEAARSGSARTVVDLMLILVIGAAMLYAVTTLALLATRVHAARLTLAASAVTAERLRIAAGLQAGLAEGLREVRGLALRKDPAVLDALIATARRTLAATRATAAELRSLSLAPEAASARALLASAGIAADLRIGHSEPLGPAGTVLATVLREAVTAVVRVGDARRCEIVTGERAGQVVLRVVSDGVPTAALGAEVLDGLADRVRSVGGSLTAGLEPDGRFAVEAEVAATPAPAALADPPELRTVLGLYVLVLGTFCVKAVLFVPVPLLGLGVPCLLLLCGLQVRFATRDAARPARLLLLGSAALAFLPLPWFGRNWIGAVGILAGALLFALPPRAGLALAGAAAVAGGLVTGGLIPGGTVGGGAAGGGGGAVPGLFAAVDVLISCVVVHGVLRLVRLVRQLQRAGAGLARAAVVTERLRTTESSSRREF
ncbi:hypothetical protein ACWC5I_39245 [Kitasatospora sp. NPDC001574]